MANMAGSKPPAQLGDGMTCGECKISCRVNMGMIGTRYLCPVRKIGQLRKETTRSHNTLCDLTAQDLRAWRNGYVLMAINDLDPATATKACEDDDMAEDAPLSIAENTPEEGL